MEKSLKLELKNFAHLPSSLSAVLPATGPASDITINLANLYSHYWQDNYGEGGKPLDLAHFEYLQHVASTPDFRMRGDGIGSNTDARRRASTALGQAFCRTFLHDHFNMTHFAHISEILKRGGKTPFLHFSVEKIMKGDAPDYFCANNLMHVYLAEAKGRYTSINFTNEEFGRWRDQFERVIIKNAHGVPESLKGYIVATRYGTEEKPKINSTIYAEDPSSPGAQPLSYPARIELQGVVTSLHYAKIARILRQNILAAALGGGYELPNEIRVIGVVWEGLVGPLKGKRFVGGFFPSPHGLPVMREEKHGLVFDPVNTLRLDVGDAIFYGLDEDIFKRVVEYTRTTRTRGTPALELPTLNIEPFYSAISILGDGTVVSPLEFFAAVGRIEI